ncbi:hypothetical protein HQ563_11280 [bacterium]|nr:hypothetical protein [bacterium]
MNYGAENEAKANFDDVYVQPTPHAYVRKMALHGYQIGEQARPYCLAAAELLKERNGEAWPVQMLDVGCSYGMGSAFVKYGCSFDEIVAFFSSRAPKDYASCCEVMRMWLNVTSPVSDMRCVGLDSSAPAIQFGLDSGLLEGGLSRDLEDADVLPTETDVKWFRSCNFLMSTGAIGYVSERTFSKVLPHLGKDHPSDFGPFALVTTLRMFDIEPIYRIFKQSGLRLTSVPGIRLPQRNFADESEQMQICRILHDKRIDTKKYEDEGTLFADLFVAAPVEQLTQLVEKVKLVESKLSSANIFSFIQR